MSGDEKEQLLDNVGPCSLLCYTCPAFMRGIIPELSNKLINYFEGYYDFQVENFPEEYKSRAEVTREFIKNLSGYTQPKCEGCRNKDDSVTKIRGCFILRCSIEQGVDFCGECSMFPCEKVDTNLFNPTLYERWVRGNRRIREVGVAQFFEEEKRKSHYIDFLKDANVQKY